MKKRVRVFIKELEEKLDGLKRNVNYMHEHKFLKEAEHIGTKVIVGEKILIGLKGVVDNEDVKINLNF